jgi:hypothetical protein
MTWMQVLTIILANIGWATTMFLWLRKEANADRKELSAGINDSKRESREFHGRLCTLEEKNRK